MSVNVITAVLEASRSEHGSRLVALVLADAAHPDGITWLGQDELQRRARLSARAVRDAIRDLEELGELETRKAQRGRRRINVHRVIVGAIADRDPRYDDLPFELKTPFSRPAEIAARREGGDRQGLPVVAEPRAAVSDTDDRQNPRASIEEPQEEPSSSPPTSESSRSLADHKAELEERVRVVFEAVEQALGHKAPTIVVHRREFARLVRMLVVEVDATPEEVKRRAAAYRAHRDLGRTMLTLPALVKWWHAFEQGSTSRDAYAATENYLRNLGHVLDDREVIDELKDRLGRGWITREQAIELLELSRELRREREYEEGAERPEADPLEDFADVRATVEASLRRIA